MNKYLLILVFLHYFLHDSVRISSAALSQVQLTVIFPLSTGIFIDTMSDYGAGFLMAGVALLVSALFLIVLHFMNKKETEHEKDICSENEEEREDLKNSNFIFGKS